MSFYDRKVIEDEKLKILDLRDVFDHHVFKEKQVIDYIEHHVKKTNAKRLVIDSITAILYTIDDRAKIRRFVFNLKKILSTLGCTAILVSEITEEGKFSAYNVEEFISDGIISLTNLPGEQQMVRKLSVIKMRGIKFRSGAVIYNIASDGIILYPKI